MEILSVFGRPQIKWESLCNNYIQCMYMFNELIVLICEIRCTVQPVQLYSEVHTVKCICNAVVFAGLEVLLVLKHCLYFHAIKRRIRKTARYMYTKLDIININIRFGGGGGVLPCKGYTRMCHWIGYGFWPFCPEQGI